MIITLNRISIQRVVLCVFEVLILMLEPIAEGAAAAGKGREKTCIPTVSPKTSAALALSLTLSMQTDCARLVASFPGPPSFLSLAVQKSRESLVSPTVPCFLFVTAPTD